MLTTTSVSSSSLSKYARHDQTVVGSKKNSLDNLPIRLNFIVAGYLDFDSIFKLYRTCNNLKQIQFIAIAISAPSGSLDTARENVDVFLKHLTSVSKCFKKPAAKLKEIVRYGKNPVRKEVVSFCRALFHFLSEKKISEETIVHMGKFIIRGLAQQPLCNGKVITSKMQQLMFSALETPKLSIVRDLTLHFGLNINLRVNFLGVKTKDVSLLTHATIYEKEEAMTYLLEHGADVNGKGKKKGNVNRLSPLHFVAQMHCNVKIARLLLLFKADVHQASRNDRDTPLHTAIKSGHHALLCELVKYDPTCLKDVNLNERTPLLQALELADGSPTDSMAVKLLLSAKADPNVGHSLISPLMLAAYQEDRASLQLLIDAKANIEAQSDASKMTALMHAARSSNEILESMLKVSPQLNTKDGNGNTALHYAVKIAFKAALQLAKQGQSAIEIILSKPEGFKNMFRLLQQNAEYNITNNAGESPLAFAMQQIEDSQAKKIAAEAIFKATQNYRKS